MLPDEIKDLILSFCEGHVRADLRIKHVGVHLHRCVYDFGEKLLLKECCLSGCDGLSLYFINKQNTYNLVGYVSKMVTEDKILYTWVKIEQT